MARNDTLDIINAALFDKEKQDKLAPADRELLERIQTTYSFWLDKPTLTDANIRDYIMVNFGLSRSKAYEQISLLKMLLGSVPQASKEFYRYKANYILDQAHAAAIAGNDRKAKALTKIAEAIAYNNRTNEQEDIGLPFDEIVPKDQSFTTDPSVLGIVPQPGLHEKASKLLKKYQDDFELDGREYDQYEEDIS